MNDLTERLRLWKSELPTNGRPRKLMHEAADRIDELEADVADRRAWRESADDWMQKARGRQRRIDELETALRDTITNSDRRITKLKAALQKIGQPYTCICDAPGWADRDCVVHNPIVPRDIANRALGDDG